MTEERRNIKGVESRRLQESEGRTLPPIKVQVKPPPMKPPKKEKK
jgi:hypothetical protein